jgi:hypothetical protein
VQSRLRRTSADKSEGSHDLATSGRLSSCSADATGQYFIHSRRITPYKRSVTGKEWGKPMRALRACWHDEYGSVLLDPDSEGDVLVTKQSPLAAFLGSQAAAQDIQFHLQKPAKGEKLPTFFFYAIMSESLANESFPRIDLYISTSSDTLDLNAETPFSINLCFVLRSDRPITFNWRDTLLDIAAAVRTKGLSFHDVHTANFAERHDLQLDICPPIPWPPKAPADYFTLTPHSPHTVKHWLGPSAGFTFYSWPVSRPSAPGDMLPLQKGWSRWWYGTRGLKDGITYELSLPDDIAISDWMYGTKEEIFGYSSWWGWAVNGAWNAFSGYWTKREGEIGKPQPQKLPYKVMETAVVAVKQAEDGPELNQW